MKKGKTTRQRRAPMPKMVDTVRTTVEWQVLKGDGGTIHVFRTEAAMRRWLHTQWVDFVSSWAPNEGLCRLNVTVRRVEKEIEL